MKREIIKKVIACRVCKSKKLTKVFRFGPTPLANAFLTKDQLDLPEAFYPLDVVFCENCSFLQLGHVASPHTLFDKYVYVSSTSPVFVSHFKKFAVDIVSGFKLNNKSFIIDIGSNDGILLKPYKKAGMRVLGVEPAKHIAKIARNSGIPTVAEFFSFDLAKTKQVKSILFFSSSEIYGDPQPNAIPTKETYFGNVSSIGHRSCYDESKRLGRLYV